MHCRLLGIYVECDYINHIPFDSTRNKNIFLCVRYTGLSDANYLNFFLLVKKCRKFFLKSIPTLFCQNYEFDYIYLKFPNFLKCMQKKCNFVKQHYYFFFQFLHKIIWNLYAEDLNIRSETYTLFQFGSSFF